jgi:23S rRNA pseudouridine1911/1915/1917 synthase
VSRTLNDGVNTPIEKTVPTDVIRLRLDHFLTGADLGLTRSRVQDLIRAGEVCVNRAPARKTGQIVVSGDVVTLSIPAPSPPNAEPESIPLDIVFEDDHLLVINKPAGMVVHPAAGHRSSTLVNALLHHCRTLSQGSGAGRPGIVHRLDKDTSGLLVAAKKDAVHLALSKQLSARTMRRRYMALVWGHPRPSSGRIDAPVGRHPKHRQKMAVTPSGRPAVTYYQVEAYLDFCSVVRLTLETGRTHQIRVHLAHIGYPVFGDPVYGGRTKSLNHLSRTARQKAEAALNALARQALHAETLGFIHPKSGSWIEMSCPIPVDIHQAMDCLR